jgi:hypothetical protein
MPAPSLLKVVKNSMTMSLSSRAAMSQTSTVQTVLPMRDPQKFAGRQLPEPAQAVGAAGGIAAGVADPADPEAAATVGPSKALSNESDKGLRDAQPFVFVKPLSSFDRAVLVGAGPVGVDFRGCVRSSSASLDLS